MPFSIRFQRNTSDSCVKWTESIHCNKAFHDACLGPMRLLLNDTFGREVSNTLASVSLLCSIIFYNVGYCSWSVTLPSHLPSENLISNPSLIDKDPYGKEFLRSHNASQKKNPKFPRNLRQHVLANVLFPKGGLPNPILVK
jgi:hypothetical protein